MIRHPFSPPPPARVMRKPFLIRYRPFISGRDDRKMPLRRAFDASATANAD
jgi:hypothetical protein